MNFSKMSKKTAHEFIDAESDVVLAVVEIVFSGTKTDYYIFPVESRNFQVYVEYCDNEFL